MADTDTAPKQDLEGSTTSMKEQFLENSTVKSNGVREVSTAGYDAALLSVGVTKQMVKTVREAENAATSAATELAADDLMSKLEGSSKEDLKNDDYRRGLSSSVRIPTYAGKTEVEVFTEKSSRIPNKFDDAGNPQMSVKNGVVRVSINATGRIHKELPGTIEDRIRKHLGK